MVNNTKKQKDDIYMGLGFSVLLKNAEFKKVQGRWPIKVDVKKNCL